MSVSAFATAANTCRPPAAVSTLPTRTSKWRSPSSRLRTKVDRDCRCRGGWLICHCVAKPLADLQRRHLFDRRRRGIRALTELVTPGSEHVVDWFHITMRVTVLEQYACGVAHHDAAAGARLLAELERSKWLLWHGNQHRAHDAIEILEDDVDGLEVEYRTCASSPSRFTNSPFISGRRWCTFTV
jgi:hypothetical protein